MKEKKIIPVKRNDDVIITIDSYTSEGFGIGRYDGFAIFVQYALIGETVNVHIIKVDKNYAIGKIIEHISINNDIRQKPTCDVYYLCGGCDMQHMNYNCQLEFKRNRVVNAVKRISGCGTADDMIEKTIGMDIPLQYRNKASFPFSEIEGKIRLGFFAPRSHKLIPITDCPIQKKDIVITMRLVEKWANENKISAYNEETNQGILRHLVIRSTYSGILVTIVTSGNTLPYQKELINILTEGIADLSGIVHNVNNKKTNVILGANNKTVYGKDALIEKIKDLNFIVRTPSFLQVNHEQTEKLYETVLRYLQPKMNENIFDIYCGIGTISLFIAKNAGKVTGIESVSEAIEDARNNAKINNVTNVEFINGEAEKIMPQLINEKGIIDSVVIDPPRKGCDEAVLNSIINCGTKKVVYVSCNPETLARDMKILLNGGFEIDKIQPVDMFPQTSHVETVVLMSRKAEKGLK